MKALLLAIILASPGVGWAEKYKPYKALSLIEGAKLIGQKAEGKKLPANEELKRVAAYGWIMGYVECIEFEEVMQSLKSRTKQGNFNQLSKGPGGRPSVEEVAKKVVIYSVEWEVIRQGATWNGVFARTLMLGLLDKHWPRKVSLDRK
jgi:hypothetical protein